MRILVISNLYPPHAIGGYEMRCWACVDALREKGHEVLVLTSDYKDGAVGLNGEIGVQRILKLHGFFGRPWLPIYKLYFVERANHRLLQATLDNFKPEGVHIWNMGGLTKSLLLRLQETGVPLLYDVSDHWIARSLAADVWLKWWNGAASRWGERLRHLMELTGLRALISKDVPTSPVVTIDFKNSYFCSAYLKDLTAARGYKVDSAIVIPCGVPIDKFKQKEAYGPLKRLLWVGRISEDKDPLMALRGVEALSEAGFPEITLTFFGKGQGPYAEAFSEALKKSPLGARVSLQHATQEQMANVYADYDALIFTSNWGEPFALTPLEAMASGLPVLMTPDGGGAELLEQGPIAISLRANDPAYLALALAKLANRPDHGRVMAEAARAIVKAFYEEKYIFDRIEDKLAESIAEMSLLTAANHL